MTELRRRSIVELRGICQALRIKFTFADDAIALAQKIELRNAETMPKPEPIIVAAVEDQRFRTLPPAKRCDETRVWAMLKPFIERGLHFKVDDAGQWEMRRAEKMDSGNLRCPPRVILRAAERMME